MSDHSEITLVMVDDDADEILLTRRQLRQDGIVNDFISQRRPERLFETLEDLLCSGLKASNIMVLLDINMPGADGFDVLKQIRSNKNFREIPVIMFSSSDDEAGMFHSFDLGASGYMVKPFRADELFAALTNVPQIKHQFVG
jgi:DNA-binding response OmpR family regulator